MIILKIYNFYLQEEKELDINVKSISSYNKNNRN